MKTIVTLIGAGGLLAALAVAQTPRYTITDLGTLPGGTYSYAYGMNSAGQVAGGAATSTQTGGVSQTAFLWNGRHMIDLGTLPGGLNSEGAGVNASGEVAMLSETYRTDPNGEDFCEFGTHRQCLAAIWKNGRLTALPTLKGGSNTAAFDINNRGQISGFAGNGIHDSTCLTGGTPFQVTRFQAVRWDADGEIQKLSPLKGDTVGFAFGMNDSGQVVGSSGLCSNTSIPPGPNGPHAVLWDNDGSPTDLGNLGGSFNVASAVNNRGQVVGGAQSAKDGTIHAFLWTRGKPMQDLGAFPGAFVTTAPCCKTINDRGDVVGFAIDAMGMRALIWQNNRPVDLNTLIPAHSPWYLQATSAINNAGEITGWGLINGEAHAFLLTPIHGGAGSDSIAPASEGVTSPAVSPEDVRKALQKGVPFGRPTGQR
jgi:probable HAF family extracellular repeat protein